VSLEFVLAVYVFLLTVFLGIELINRVPATLHTPLMSATTPPSLMPVAREHTGDLLAIARDQAQLSR
jgi:hypothetical protein